MDNDALLNGPSFALYRSLSSPGRRALCTWWMIKGHSARAAVLILSYRWILKALRSEINVAAEVRLVSLARTSSHIVFHFILLNRSGVLWRFFLSSFCFVFFFFGSYSSCTVSTVRFAASIESLRFFPVHFFILLLCAMRAYTVRKSLLYFFFISLRSLSFLYLAVFTHCTKYSQFCVCKRWFTKNEQKKKSRQSCCHRDRCSFSIAIAAWCTQSAMLRSGEWTTTTTTTCVAAQRRPFAILLLALPFCFIVARRYFHFINLTDSPLSFFRFFSPSTASTFPFMECVVVAVVVMPFNNI